MTERMRPPLLVFSDDWGRHPSSCQHLIRQLLDRHQVYWVNTIGTRKPGFNLATLRRGWGKLVQWLRPGPTPQKPDANPAVLNPRMWPWFSSAFDRWVNRKILIRNLTSLIGRLPCPPVAITTIPLVADLVGELPVRHWTYYCVDDFSVWPGLDGHTLRALEDRLLRRVDRVIAVSETLQTHLSKKGWNARLLTHGVDLDHWRNEAVPMDSPLPASLPRPLIVFWGVVDRRLDYRFLDSLSHRLDKGTVLLVGPTADPDPRLRKLPRLRLMPSVRYEELPALAREAAVLVMPYADLAVTRAMQPLKLKEYLATGKPAVVRLLPSTEVWGDCLDLAGTPEEFARLVCERLDGGLSTSQNLARGRLAQESWPAKAALFAKWAVDVEEPAATAAT